jgi:hypothetical protein
VTLFSKRRALHCALAAAACVAVLGLPGAAAGAGGPAAYRHLGTWVDIFDGPVLSSPSSSVAQMKNKGVDTIYIETANAASATFVNRSAVGQLVQFAHNKGIKVVAWTLPGHSNEADDWAKAKAAIRFKSSRGDRFDGFALDIESTQVSNIKTRNSRLLALSKKINQATALPLGAITYSPVFINGPWPNFPWARVAKIYDVFLPMAYSSYHYNSESSVRKYTEKAVKILRQKTSSGQPIHVVGGIADKMSGSETRGFVRALINKNVAGGSLYDFRTSDSADWKRLANVP